MIMDIEGKSIVIFDSNAYRNFVSGIPENELKDRVDKLIELEKQNDIISLMSPIVLSELMAHLADPSDTAYNKCKNAVKALYWHCGDEQEFRMLADPELILCKSFFDMTVQSREDSVLYAGQVASQIADDDSEANMEKFRPIFRQIRDHVYQAEINFATDIQAVIKEIDPDGSEWRLFELDDKKRKQFLDHLNTTTFEHQIGLGFALRAYLLLVEHNLITVDPNFDLVSRAKKIADLFKAAIELYKEVYRRIVNSEFNLFEKSRANFLWDIHLMFSIGDEKVKDCPLYFVTHDKAMLQAAEKVGHNLRVFTLTEYLEYLGFE